MTFEKKPKDFVRILRNMRSIKLILTEVHFTQFADIILALVVNVADFLTKKSILQQTWIASISYMNNYLNNY